MNETLIKEAFRDSFFTTQYDIELADRVVYRAQHIFDEYEPNISKSHKTTGYCADYIGGGSFVISKPQEYAEFTNKGGGPYTVTLSKEDGIIVSKCQCPAYQNPKVCKHSLGLRLAVAECMSHYHGNRKEFLQDLQVHENHLDLLYRSIKCHQNYSTTL